MNNYGVVKAPSSGMKRRLASEMRDALTPAEERLWGRLRRNMLAGLHFRRQQVIDGFIADFYCHSAALVVEVDGPIHDEHKESDTERDAILAGRGLRVMRFPNKRIETEIKSVLDEILAAATDRLPAKNPDNSTG